MNWASLVVLFLIIWTDLNHSVEPHFPYDRLSPYEEGVHGSRYRTTREIAQCQHEDWNNFTYEEFESQPPSLVSKSTDIVYDLYRYEDTVKSVDTTAFSVHRMRYLIGSIAYVKDPYYTLSVLEPSEPGGCKKKYYNYARSTVSATSSKRPHGCRLAINAGYFSMSNGQCLGNIVSDGQILQTTRDQNVNFGIRHDGTLVVGYISEEEILDGSFRQLIAGVIWLVRNGSNYVNESMSLECSSHQNTGKMATFVNVLSARTAIGHDKQGRVVIANVEGQTHRRGSNLYEFADLLISHGLVNAINLDGGGSSTFIQDKVLINYPTDHCPGNSAYRCERPVSTILCFHDVQCLEPSCNGHGSCQVGTCQCDIPWIGDSCGSLNCSIVDCSSHGNCTDGVCACESGWQGTMCEKECLPNYYGPGCASKCWCHGRNSVCDRFTGVCHCLPGYIGPGCWKECPDGFFGHNCSQRCPSHNCSDHGKCSFIDGSCLCSSNWTGVVCEDHAVSSSSFSSSPSQLSVSQVTFHEMASSVQELNSTPAHSPPIPMLHTSSIVTTSSDRLCDDKGIERKSSSLNFVLAILIVCLVTLGSLLVHVFICIKGKGRLKEILRTHLISSIPKQRRRRRRRKRTFTPLVEDSSSDCSI